VRVIEIGADDDRLRDGVDANLDGVLAELKDLVHAGLPGVLADVDLVPGVVVGDGGTAAREGDGGEGSDECRDTDELHGRFLSFWS
jgi:hypothetical protein